MIASVIFAAGDKPYCAWGPDLAEKNAQFIADIDDKYFHYIARTHLEHIDGEDAQRAALSLRANYHLSLETLFSLVGAAIQAPNCVPGWILKISTAQLRSLVKEIQEERMPFAAAWRPATIVVGFDAIASLLLQYTPWAKIEGDNTVADFAKLWSRLASDFLDSYSVKEYNSIKHGFRARSGGFHLAIGLQREKGTPAPPDEMHSLGGSKFGTSFFSAEAVKGAPEIRNDPHFRLRQNSLNWLPDATAARMMLAAISITNIKGFLSVISGKAPDRVMFSRPENAKDFFEPWNHTIGITSSNFDTIVREDQIYRATKEELLAKLNRSE